MRELEATCADPVFRAVAAYCGLHPEQLAADPALATAGPSTSGRSYTEIEIPWYALARFEEDPDRRPYIWQLDEGDYVTDD